MEETAPLNIRDLGNLAGKVLLFGGPYSNLQASQAMQQVAKSRGIEPSHRICTGDLVAYCANPVETVQLWQDQCVLVAGNCEKQLATQAPECGCGFAPGSACDMLAKTWYPFANSALSNAHRAVLAAAPDIVVFSHCNKRYAIIHGGISDVATYLWPVSRPADFRHEIDLIFDLVGPVDGVVAGHSGIPFSRQIGNVSWVNCGTIAMPANDGSPATYYAILNDQGLTIERLHYDHRAAHQAMLAAGLTQGYETALLSGYWPSQDILPLQMRHHGSLESG